MKCTGEPDGCQRCLARNLACYYPRRLKARRGTSFGQPSKNGSERPDAAPENTSGASSAFSSDETPPYSFIHTDADPDVLESLNENGSGFPLSDIVSEPYEFFDSLGEVEQDADENFGFCSPTTSTGTVRTFQGSNTNSTFDDSSFTPEDFVISQTVSLPTPPTYDTKCSCFERAINTYEGIQINLVWGLCHLQGGGEDLLNNQKRALTDCEGLLECESCRAKSGFMMLVISMCDRILVSIETLDLGDADESSEVQTPLNDETGPQRTLKIGRWKVDNDDERHAIGGLLAARKARLGNLVTSIGDMISGHHWAAHKAMVLDIRMRVFRSATKLKNAQQSF